MSQGIDYNYIYIAQNQISQVKHVTLEVKKPQNIVYKPVISNSESMAKILV